MRLQPASWVNDHMYSLAYGNTTNQTILDFFYFENEHVTGLIVPPKPKVYECVLYFCVQEFTAIMENGNYSETLVSTWPDPHHKLEHFPDFAWQKLPYPRNYPIKNVTLSPPSAAQDYSVDTFTFALLRTWLFDYLANGVGMESYLPSTALGSDTAEAIYEIQRSTTKRDGDSAAERLSVVVSRGLSLAMRALADPTTAAQGHARERKAFVEARWAFVVLPVALVLMTCLFLAATLALTVRRGLPVWKSSALATLAHGLQEGDIMADRLDVLERKASGQYMTMSEDQHQRRFVAVRS